MKFNGKFTLGSNVVIGENVRIGDNCIIYDNVKIGDNTTVCNNSVIGEPTFAYYSSNNYENPLTIIGADSLIRSHNIIYAGSTFGRHLTTGHNVIIRENSSLGSNCQVGSFADIQGNCKLGANCRMQSYVIVGQGSVIGDCVFLYPFVVLTNDPTPPSTTLNGVEIGDFCVITTSSVLLPGTKIRRLSMVSANSTVSGEFPEDSFISGSPAKLIGLLSKMPFFNEEKVRHYPWMRNFSRNMPWDGIGFDNWIANND